MDITSIEGATAFQAAQTKEKIGMAVLAKSMSIAKQQGQEVIEMIEAATETLEHSAGSPSNSLDITA